MRTRVLDVDVNEGDSGVVSFVFNDADGAPIPKTNVSALTLDLFDQASEATINSRADQDVLDANGVTLGETDGLVTWSFDPEDAPFLGETEDVLPPVEEIHVARFTLTYSAGTVSKLVHMRVRNIQRLQIA